MNTRKHLITYLLILFTIAIAPLFAAPKAEEQLKTDIYDSFDIRIYDEDCLDGSYWEKPYLNAMIQVFRDVPPNFLSCTKMVYMVPNKEQFEIKYNGYNEENGIIQVGYGAFLPCAYYLKQFTKVYGKSPTESDKLNHFKTMLVRGMAYSFIQENTDAYGRSDLIDSYKSVYSSEKTLSTKVYSISDDNYMVVAPGRNHLWTDLAFAVAQYCTNASGLKSKYPKRYEFVKEYVFGGCGVDGWSEKYLDGTGQTTGGDGHTGDYYGTITDVSTDTYIDTDTPTYTDTDTDTPTYTDTDTDTPTYTDTDTDTPTNTDTDTDTPTNTNTDTNSPTNTDTEISVNDRTDIPSIPDGDYLPVVSQVNVGSIGLDNAMMTMPNGMKRAIKELFQELPKYFTTCTLGISYMPTQDTCDAFASEGYIFVTNNSWFGPSFIEIDDTDRANRFKQILLREMTKCFLYYHGSRITQWRGAIGPEITNEDAITDIVEATVLYYTDPEYLKELSNPKELKWSFVKNNIFSNNGGENPPPVTPTQTPTNTNTDTDTSTETTASTCYKVQQKIINAVTKYNKEHNNEMESLDIDTLVAEKYLDEDPNVTAPGCQYASKGILTEGGYIQCKKHGKIP